MTRILRCMLIVVLSILTSCVKEINENMQSVDINKFPINIKLDVHNAKTLNINSLGVSEIKTTDSLLVVSVLDNEKFWHVYSVPEMDSIGSYFDVGNAPYELPMPIPCVQSSFYKKGNDLYCALPIPGTHKLLEANFSKLMSNNNYENNTSKLDVYSPDMTIWTYFLDSNRYLQANAEPNSGRIIRTIRNYPSQAQVNSDNKYIENLNSRSVANMEELNLLLTMPAIRPDGNKVAEIPGYSNQIYVYDTTGKDGVCIEYANIAYDDREMRMLSGKKHFTLWRWGWL